MKRQKELLIIASVSALAACGGGGGGSDGGTNDIVSIAATTPGSTSSSGYDTKDLAYNINILFNNNDWSVSGNSTITASHLTGNYAGLNVSNTDEITSYLNGQVLDLTENWNSVMGSYYSFNLGGSSNFYEFKFTRGGALVVEGSIDALPEYILATGSVNGNDVYIDITEAAEHVYTYNAESLDCKAYGESVYENLAHNVYVGEDEEVLVNDYQKSIADVFNEDVALLQANYETCTVSVLLSATSNAINIMQSHRNIGIHPISARLLEVTLF